MRIIAGTLGGRQFKFTGNKRTHPMSEKGRGGLFNSLGDISGLKLLDAFAGSGAISFEAISRGATEVVAVEVDKKVYTSIKTNKHNLFTDDNVLQVIRANTSAWSDAHQSQKFDIVVCDPPYDDIKPELLTKLANHTTTGGIVIYSLPPNAAFELPANSYKQLTVKNYGDATLVFYRKIA